MRWLCAHVYANTFCVCLCFIMQYSSLWVFSFRSYSFSLLPCKKGNKWNSISVCLALAVTCCWFAIRRFGDSIRGANSRRVKDMVSQPNKRLGQAREMMGWVWVIEWFVGLVQNTLSHLFTSSATAACPRLRLILPDPTAIRVGLSHASRHSNVWHTAQ